MLEIVLAVYFNVIALIIAFWIWKYHKYKKSEFHVVEKMSLPHIEMKGK